jgi:hypothetical protein
MPDPWRDRYYAPGEIAAILHVSTREVYRWIADLDDPLPATRLRQNGHVLRVYGPDVRAYLARHRKIPQDE